MISESMAIDRLAAFCAAKHKIRALILVSDKISESIGANRWDRVRKWQGVRAEILAKHGMII